MIRLDKYLCEMEAGTRSEVKAFIKKGRVTVNGETAKSPEQKVDETKDTVTLDGHSFSYQKYFYYMLHKPAGVVTAVRDHHDQTVLDLLVDAPGKDLSPVGRLDKDTEGLLLVTDDGALSHALMSPTRHVSKVYEAEIDGELVPDAAERFASGLTLRDGTECRPATLERLPDGRVRVTLHEGKYHQVKRMIAACGATVTYLKRVQLGNVRLDESLAPGEFRELAAEELASLRPPDA